MRQVVLDTETTGISYQTGHRIIEIGCVELVNRRVTKRYFHKYINPLRDVDYGAFKVHGISSDFLKDKPVFSDILAEFIDFIDGDEVIIHNAAFDVGFLNNELKLAKHKKTFENHCKIFDTLVFAREKHPGLKNNLDALCKRYNIDNSNRDLHGALLDAEILAFVYLAMTGGQATLFSLEDFQQSRDANVEKITVLTCTSPVIYADPMELKYHEEFVSCLK